MRSLSILFSLVLNLTIADRHEGFIKSLCFTDESATSLARVLAATLILTITTATRTETVRDCWVGS